MELTRESWSSAREAHGKSQSARSKAGNRFLVFAGVLFLLLGGIWSLQRIPLDALPDISDVQVIVHTPWPGRPPNVIEDQVTYPIVTTLLAAPHVKAVRAQTMFGDSYVFV